MLVIDHLLLIVANANIVDKYPGQTVQRRLVGPLTAVAVLGRSGVNSH